MISNIAIGIPFIITCLIIIALIIYAVYSSIYKKRINQKLQNNESTAHVPMASSASLGKGILIIGMIIVSIVNIYMLSNISTTVSDMEATINNIDSQKHIINSLRGEISALKNKIEEQNDLFTMFESELGEVDNVNHTVEAIFKCIPQTSGNDTSISVTIENNSVTLEKNSEGIYSGKMALPLFEDVDETFASITTNGITTSTSIYIDFYSSPYIDCLPELWGNLEDFDFKFNNNKFYTNLIYWSDAYDENNGTTAIDPRKSMNDLKLIFKINGKIEKEMAITKKFNDISEEFPAQAGDKVEIIVQGIDYCGYIHQRLLLETDSNNSWSEASSDTILDSKGNMLYNGEWGTIHVETEETIE